MRFGDLDGDGRLDMLFAQQVPKVRGDAFDQISCLTAVTLEGKVLWQQGRANPKNDLLTNDTPFQIHDLDGDGGTEVVLARDFQLQVLDGRTGKLLRSAWLPQMSPEIKDRPYEINNGDSLLFVDVSGAGAPRDILVKDRYRGFWIFNRDLKPCSEGFGQTGHYPFAIDVNGDRREEFLIGYSLWELDGQRRWSHDTTLQRSRRRAVDRQLLRPRRRAAACLVTDRTRFCVRSPAARCSAPPPRPRADAERRPVPPDAPGLQIMIANFWRNPGIVSCSMTKGTVLKQDEIFPLQSPGAGELARRRPGAGPAPGNIREGGMVDGELRRVVMSLTTGIRIWRRRCATSPAISATRSSCGSDAGVDLHAGSAVQRLAHLRAGQEPHYNDSNYRASVSLPGWAPLRNP